MWEIDQLLPYNQGEILNAIEFFHKYNQRFIDKNINHYSLSSLNEEIKELKNKPTDSEIKKSEKFVNKVYEDDNWNVFYIKSREAARIYGANTKWCITSYNEETSVNMFNRYSCAGIGFIFYLINKNPKNTIYDKIACTFDIYPIGIDENKNHYIMDKIDESFVKKHRKLTAYDVKDVKISKPELVEIMAGDYFKIFNPIYSKICDFYNSMPKEEKNKLVELERVKDWVQNKAEHGKNRNIDILFSMANNRTDWAIKKLGSLLFYSEPDFNKHFGEEMFQKAKNLIDKLIIEGNVIALAYMDFKNKEHGKALKKVLIDGKINKVYLLTNYIANNKTDKEAINILENLLKKYLNGNESYSLNIGAIKDLKFKRLNEVIRNAVKSDNNKRKVSAYTLDPKNLEDKKVIIEMARKGDSDSVIILSKGNEEDKKVLIDIAKTGVKNAIWKLPFAVHPPSKQALEELIAAGNEEAIKVWKNYESQQGSGHSY